MNELPIGVTAIDAIVAMAKGNVGASVAMSTSLMIESAIDPKTSSSFIHSLDGYGIYGPSIHILFKDKCDSNIRKFIMIIRATQLGFFNHNRLQQMAAEPRDYYLSEEEFNSLDDQVCERLPDFQKRKA